MKMNHSNLQANGVFQAPPPSLPRSYPLLKPANQPPILPLPAAGGFSCSPINKKTVTPKKPKSSNHNHKNELKLSPNRPSEPTPLRHHPKQERSKNCKRVLDFNSSNSVCCNVPTNSLNCFRAVEDQPCDNMFSGSVAFSVSPPPSSLPLPSFSFRTKLRCNVGIDAGATDDLRRLLRLQG